MVCAARLGRRGRRRSRALAAVVFDGEQRQVRLRRGRVFIETGHAAGYAQQPFVVAAAQVRVTALGTRFSVARQPERVRVAVIEARVAVRTAGGDPVILGQGQSAGFSADGLIEQAALDRNDSAWQRGMLVADDMMLGDFVTALGRYRDGVLSCDPAVAGLRISGVFPLRDTDRALAALTETLPVRIERADADVRVRPK